MAKQSRQYDVMWASGTVDVQGKTRSGGKQMDAGPKKQSIKTIYRIRNGCAGGVGGSVGEDDGAQVGARSECGKLYWGALEHDGFGVARGGEAVLKVRVMG